MRVWPAYVRSGNRYRWRGLPGQERMDAVIEVHSMTATCGINAVIDFPGNDEDPPDRTLITIGAADLLAAITAGWLEQLPATVAPAATLTP